MDETVEHRSGYIAGLLAAQLAVDYVSTHVNPIHERALDLGMYGMLGCYLTNKTPLTPREMDYADVRQRETIFSGILDDPVIEGVSKRRSFDSITSMMQTSIRLNPFEYFDGRVHFSQWCNDIVDDYKATIRATPPAAEIVGYLYNDKLSVVVNRFLQVRRSLQSYVPRLVALDEEIWRYARTFYAQHPLR